MFIGSCSPAAASLWVLRRVIIDHAKYRRDCHLLLLFNQEAPALAQWLQATPKQRKAQFSPVRVRLRLEEIGQRKSVDLQILTVDEQRYGALCETATHATPRTRPQAHNPLGLPFAGAEFQEAGVFVALNELALATALALLSIPRLLGYDDQKRSEIQEAGITLLQSIGGVDITTEGEVFAKMWQQAEKDTEKR
jgi:hypothetical protein